MKRWITSAVCCVALIAFSVPAFATNGAQLIGFGSTQKGVAGAVTAAPEDAMTAVTNPAGMGVIGKRADFNGEAFMPTRSMDFKELVPVLGGPGSQTDGGSGLYGVPSFGWTAPAFGRSDMWFGGGMYATAGMGVDYDPISAGGAFGEADVFSLLQFAKIAPAAAWNVNDRLTVGASLNFDYQLLEIREKFAAPGFKPFSGYGLPTSDDGIHLDLGRAIAAYGGGVTFGAIYKVNDMVTVGASWASEQYFPDMKFRIDSNAIRNFPAGEYIAKNTSAGTYKLDMNFPQQAAVGIAVRPIEPLTLSLDVKWINWSGTHDKVRLSGQRADAFTLYQFTGTSFNTSTAKSIDLPFGWDDQWVIAVGARYVVNPALTLRIGYNYSESPIDQEDVFNNVAFPAIVEQHLGLGLTYNLGDHWALSGSYMKAFNNDISGKKDVPKAYQNLGFVSTSQTKIELKETSLGVQISYRF